MSKLPLDQAIQRIQANDERMDRFANGGDTETWQTSGGVVVPSFAKFVKDHDAQLTAFPALIQSQSGAANVGTVPAGGLASDNVQAALNELDNEKINFTRLAQSDGSSLSGFQQLDTGSIPQNLQIVGRERLNGSNFGMVPDWNGSTGTNNTAAFIVALTALRNRGGGILTINPGDYYFGAFSSSVDVVSIVNLVNSKIAASGARFILNTTTDDTTPFLLAFDSPNNVVLEGARFFDVGFNPASWQTHSRWGMGCVRLKAASACRGFTMRDCVAENVTYMLIADHRAQRRNMQHINVENCRVTNAYYGVDVLYVGDNLRISNLICKDVRRGLIGYGMRNFDADIKLYTSSGFLGSNAFVSIACEGEAYNDGNGVLGVEGNVRNGRVSVDVSGFEAHEAYIHLYHQQANSSGDISNIDAKVFINDLSSAGKNVLIGPTNAYQIDHELPSTAIQDPTLRTCKQISLDARIVGSITGLPIKLSSQNTGSPHTLALSPALTKLAHTYTINQFTQSDFQTQFAKNLNTLVPVGGTTTGTPTGLVTSGTWIDRGKRVQFNAVLSWTNHTGTGQLRVSGLPKPVDATFGTLFPVNVVADGLTHTAGRTLWAMVGGTGGSQILIYEDNAGALATVAMDTAVTSLWISGEYPTA